MNNVINKLQEVSADEIMREKYNAREKARLDYKSAMKYAENRGMEKGRLETAKNLLRHGISPELIAEATELPLDEILEFKKEIEN